MKDLAWVDEYQMLREKFVASAVRRAESASNLPRGWVGRWTDARGPEGERVLFSAGAWTVSYRGKRVSRHGSREGAFRAAKRQAQKGGIEP